MANAPHAASPFAACLSPATPNRPVAVGELRFPTSPAPVATATASSRSSTSTPRKGDVAKSNGGSKSQRNSNTTVPRRSLKLKRRGRPRGKDDRSRRWNTGKWSASEDAALREGVRVVGARQWKRISIEFLHNLRSDVQCLHRWQKVLRPGLVKGAWEKDEDETIVRCIRSGIVKWSEIAAHIPGRLGKQCRERWFNHLDPSIKKGGWTAEEDRILEQAQATLGNRWCKIAEMLPGRTENAVKNRWHSAKRRQAHAQRLANAAAARKSGRPLPPAPKLKLPTTRRKGKSHAPTPAAAMEAARRCGLNISASVGKPLPLPRPRTTTSGTGRRRRRRHHTASPHHSPTRPGPAPRPFVFPSTPAQSNGPAEVVTPYHHPNANFGLMQLISAIASADTSSSTTTATTTTAASLTSTPTSTIPPPPPATPSRLPAHGRVAPQRHMMKDDALHMQEPDAHTPLPHPGDESSAIEALQAMHSSHMSHMPASCAPAAVDRCTPSPPIKLAVNTPVTVADDHLCYTLLPPPPTQTGDGVVTFIVEVSPADDVADNVTTAAPAPKRPRPAAVHAGALPCYSPQAGCEDDDDAASRPRPAKRARRC